MKLSVFAAGSVTLAITAATLGAPVVTAPVKQIDVGTASEHYFDVGVSGSGGELFAGYEVYLSLVPQGGAVGSISLTGDWAIEHPTDPFFAGYNPAQNTSGFVTDALLAGDAELIDTKYFFRVVLDIAPETLGTFTIDLNESNSVLLDGMYTPLPGITWQDGSITVVPEPAAFGLMGLAGSVLALRRRRQA